MELYHSPKETAQNERAWRLALLEALLFVAPDAVSIAQLAFALELSVEEVQESLEELQREYQDMHHPRGLRIERFRGRVQLVTMPEAAPLIERFLGLEIETRLSQAALETLAIILYKQPITRPQIDAIRGVNSDAVLKGLVYKGLVQEVGRDESPGRPILYAVTPEVLRHFGLTSLAELPPLDLEQGEMSDAPQRDG